MGVSVTMVVLLLRLASSTADFIAYDCGIEDGKMNATFSEISLKSVKECSYAAQSYNEAKDVYMQVLKRVEEHQVNAINCNVKLKLKTSACGWDGIYSYIYIKQLILLMNIRSRFPQKIALT